LTFDWAEFARIAKSLAAAAKDEAAHRTAISRAYYCAYHKARIWREHQSSFRTLPLGEGSHSALWDAFVSSSNKLEMQVGHIGKRLKEYRTKADYRMSYPEVSFHADGSIKQMEKLISLLDEITSSRKSGNPS